MKKKRLSKVKSISKVKVNNLDKKVRGIQFKKFEYLDSLYYAIQYMTKLYSVELDKLTQKELDIYLETFTGTEESFNDEIN